MISRESDMNSIKFATFHEFNKLAEKSGKYSIGFALAKVCCEVSDEVACVYERKSLGGKSDLYSLGFVYLNFTIN